MKEKAQNFWKDFSEFAFKDNLVSLATGIIIGTSVKDLSTSFVEDVLLPPLGLLLGRVDFSQLYISLSTHRFSSLSAAQEAGVPVIRYGEFLTELIDFFLMALTIYLVFRVIFRWRPKKKD